MLRGNHLEPLRGKLYQGKVVQKTWRNTLLSASSNETESSQSVQYNSKYIGKAPKKLAQISMTVVIQFSLETSKYFQNNILIDHPWKNGLET